MKIRGNEILLSACKNNSLHHATTDFSTAKSYKVSMRLQKQAKAQMSIIGTFKLNKTHMQITKEEASLRYERYIAFNEERLSAAKEVMDRRTRNIFEQVPVILHYNDPHIPGFRQKNIPYGIDGFKPNAYQSAWLSRLGVDPTKPSSGKHSIKALYCMGSTASIGQGKASDLDLWVCVGSDLSDDETATLRDKCSFITSYAASLGVEVNLFITPEDRFTRGMSGEMDTEDCGSAQSLFLLDEFYRSSLRICGRCIIWYLISPDEELKDYRKAVEALQQSGFGHADLWFDFGSITKSSPSEYFGSGLWLLYKGIDSPFKAVLKSLLMEAYAANYPSVELVSLQFKRQLFKNIRSGLGVDAYFLMYRNVAIYLKAIADFERLELVRRCFYLKISNALEGMPECKQKQVRIRLLRRLCMLWKWNFRSQDARDILKKRSVEDVLKTEQQLFDSFMKSYKALLGFSVSHGIEYAITSDDAGVLSRKLYAAYDCYAGKILHLSRSLLGSITQKKLYFIYTGDNRLCFKGWHVYASADPFALLETGEIYSCKTLTEAVVWCVYNGICDHETRIICKGPENSSLQAKVNRLVDQLLDFFEKADLNVVQQDLSRTRRLRECLALINFEQDETADATISVGAAEGTSLSCGHDKRCLIGSVAAITVNSWGEVNCHHFANGAQGVVELMTYVMRQNAKDEIDSSLVKRTTFYSCSINCGELIRYDLEELLRELAWCALDSDSSYSFEVGTETYTAKNSGSRGISITRHSPFGTVDITVLTRYGMRPEYALQVPMAVESSASIGITQYFFAPLREKGHWDIYVADEQNKVMVYRDYIGSRSELVNAVNRFVTRQTEDHTNYAENFNLPQYFVLSHDFRSIHPFSIRL